MIAISKELFADIKPSVTNKYSRNIFITLKPYIAEKIYQIIILRKVNNRGPKPKKENISRSLDAIFEYLDSGTKIEYIEEHYKISRATFYRYFKLTDNLIVEIHKQLFGASPPSLSVTDSSHVRSIDGSEGVSYGYKEKSKNACKITILAGMNKVIYDMAIHPDNLSDHVAFQDMIQKRPLDKSIDVLADSGYNGKVFKEICEQNGYHVTSCIKKYKNANYSHQLTKYEKMILKENRSKVEHIFAQLKRFRAIQVKINKRIWIYFGYLRLAALLVSIQNGIINKGPKSTIKLTLKSQ